MTLTAAPIHRARARSVSGPAYDERTSRPAISGLQYRGRAFARH